MPFTYEIKVRKSRRDTEHPGEEANRYIEITGFEGAIRALKIPDKISDLPVERIAARAFADRADLEEVYLPAGLKGLGPFAFYNCPRLSYLGLFDRIGEYNDGVIRHCKSLEEIEITMGAAPNYELLRRLLADNDRKLHLFVHMPDGDFSLIFPEYLVDFKEDTFARALHFRIEGGYASRECITRQAIDFASYDAGFYQTTVDDGFVAAEAAFERLLYPYALRDEYRNRYEQYLREAAAKILPNLIRKGDQQKINLLTERGLLDKEAVSKAIAMASETGASEICAVLLAYKENCFSARNRREQFFLESL